MNEQDWNFPEVLKQLLTNVNNWSINSSLFRTDEQPLKTTSHKQWLSEHTDSHPRREILIAAWNESLCSLNGEVYPCRPNSFFLYDSFEKHDYYYPPDVLNILHIWLVVQEKELTGSLISVHRNNIIGKQHAVCSDPQLCTAFNRLWDNLKTSRLPEDIRRKELSCGLFLLLSALLESCLENTRNGNAAREERQELAVRAIMSYIRSNLSSDLSADKLAKLAGYSKFHFIRLFAKIAGMSLRDYIVGIKTEQVTKLRKEGLSDKEIAEMLGYSSASAFSRWMNHTSFR